MRVLAGSSKWIIQIYLCVYYVYQINFINLSDSCGLIQSKVCLCVSKFLCVPIYLCSCWLSTEWQFTIGIKVKEVRHLHYLEIGMSGSLLSYYKNTTNRPYILYKALFICTMCVCEAGERGSTNGSLKPWTFKMHYSNLSVCLLRLQIPEHTHIRFM